MKVCAGKSMPRLAAKGSTTRVATRMMAAGKKRASGKATTHQVAAGVAAMTALTASAPALAAVNEVGQVAGAEFLPSVLVPLVGLVFPGVAMASLFIYVTKEQPAK
ncbi:putative subunit VIII of photosystem I reaction center [Chloropicon primus]|uniref:Photosystem I reaction center subunit VIII n=1 Tax=Chloropicon primus TaxID=1764295 RepID=A0A5B8MK86_9CHLO|nr:putative subunit VIII of photosystem I reaction center [Chloropicon primus]UPQ99893.1 putative subunit VIII of photosystem I reaction center [Chloropicon primus]|mmetsp:Transcript_8573/g.24521  ORF Transcript_8573/g.24521 Transcript_8573/m.24521 type:complete len:106 (+) Transcript_8573:102-419(+)|eukprot:QDZ20681.1 putative subunit VIII of photosystem I reaction center [Chloropicon primus]